MKPIIMGLVNVDTVPVNVVDDIYDASIPLTKILDAPSLCLHLAVII
jgi:hypothetical protein